MTAIITAILSWRQILTASYGSETKEIVNQKQVKIRIQSTSSCYVYSLSEVLQIMYSMRSQHLRSVAQNDSSNDFALTFADENNCWLLLRPFQLNVKY